MTNLMAIRDPWPWNIKNWDSAFRVLDEVLADIVPTYYAYPGTDKFTLDLPGVKKESLKIEVNGNVLSIKAERGSTKIEKFITVGEIAKVEAELQDGVLTVNLVRPNQPNKVEIEIK